MRFSSVRVVSVCVAIGATTWLAGCASRHYKEPAPTQRAEFVFAINQQHELIRFNAGEPQRVLARLPLTGLAAGERVVGMDFRVARGVLYVLADSGQLYTANTATASLTPVGAATGDAVGPQLKNQRVGVDFNPAADRIRVVTATGHNWRLHPDTGAWVDGNAAQDGVQADGALVYAPEDAQSGVKPVVVAAAYTYNKDNEKLTTNYAIDVAGGRLVMQGSREGSTPSVSPNTGQLRTVGALGVPRQADAAFDIADTNNAALAALSDGRRTRLFQISLETGQARLLGMVDKGQALLGMAIEP